MRKAIFLISLLIVIAISGCILDGFTSYDHSQFKIKYPQDWQVRENFEGRIVDFLQPQAAAHFSVVSIKPIPQDITDPEQNIEEIIGSLESQGFYVVERAPIIIGENPAFKIVGTDSENTGSFAYIWTIKDNKEYILSYGIVMEKYNAYISTIEEMINSFEFK
ncbi:MAG: hypothetical protein JW772_05490 [Candidatus Diapherotrites archaeon]|nr:hypothetical protein [Candidatus Diapherotrites archaeon]